MLYPRATEDGELVEEKQMVGHREHLTQNHRILFLNGIIGAPCAACGVGETESHNLLLALSSLSSDPITIIITSPGGVLTSTFMLYDTMKLIPAPIYTVGRFCASAATLLLAVGDKRYLFPSAKVMLHLPSGMLVGDSRDIDIQQIEMRKTQNDIITLLQEHGVKRTKAEILRDIDRDYWMTAKEAIDYGLADEIVTPELMKEWLGGDE